MLQLVRYSYYYSVYRCYGTKITCNSIEVRYLTR
jgi:hypothetical protein